MRGINFRPKVDPGKLLQIAKKQHYSDLSGFINDAIEEKIRHVHEDPRDHKLISSIKKALYEYNNWTFSKPSPQEAVKIKKRAEEMRSGKEKSIPLSDIIHKLEKMPTLMRFHEVSPKLKKDINQRAKAVETGKVKATRWKGSVDDLLKD